MLQSARDRLFSVVEKRAGAKMISKSSIPGLARSHYALLERSCKCIIQYTIDNAILRGY